MISRTVPLEERGESRVRRWLPAYDVSRNFAFSSARPSCSFHICPVLFGEHGGVGDSANGNGDLVSEVDGCCDGLKPLVRAK